MSNIKVTPRAVIEEQEKERLKRQIAEEAARRIKAQYPEDSFGFDALLTPQELAQLKTESQKIRTAAQALKGRANAGEKFDPRNDNAWKNK